MAHQAVTCLKKIKEQAEEGIERAERAEKQLKVSAVGRSNQL